MKANYDKGTSYDETHGTGAQMINTNSKWIIYILIYTSNKSSCGTMSWTTYGYDFCDNTQARGPLRPNYSFLKCTQNRFFG